MNGVVPDFNITLIDRVSKNKSAVSSHVTAEISIFGKQSVLPNQNADTMKNRVIEILFAVLMLMNFSVWAQHSDWPASTENSKPWTRWWWMDNAVDKENISRELQEMAKAGIGGVEITPIYGVKGEDARAIPFLSQGFADILNFTIGEAHQLGMGVDLPAGSGWRNGGPFVPEEKGLWSMKLQKMEVKAGTHWKLPVDIGIVEAASFVSADKKVQVIDAAQPFAVTENGTI